MTESQLRWKRVLLKLGGESLSQGKEHPLSFSRIDLIVREIKEVKDLGVEMGIMIGGGNILRGEMLAQKGMDKTTADYMGMLATVINALALQDALEKIKVPARVQTAIEMQKVAEPYIRRRAIDHLQRGRVVIFAGGTGNPYFTTDTAAALRALEVGAQVFLKATKVDGIYSSDPLRDAEAKKFDRIGYMDVLNRKLKVMDAAAISLCMDNNLPIIVFSIEKKGNIKKIILGENIGTVVSNFELGQGGKDEGKTNL